MRVTVSAMRTSADNWQNAYIVSLSKGLDALEGQAAVVAFEWNRASIEDSVAVISRKLAVSSRPRYGITTFSLFKPYQELFWSEDV